MNHQDLISIINNKIENEGVRHRGMLLSQLEAIQQILIENEIVSELEFNHYFDNNLKRNFSIK
jgi:hypothetical protein